MQLTVFFSSLSTLDYTVTVDWFEVKPTLETIPISGEEKATEYSMFDVSPMAERLDPEFLVKWRPTKCYGSEIICARDEAIGLVGGFTFGFKSGIGDDGKVELKIDHISEDCECMSFRLFVSLCQLDSCAVWKQNMVRLAK
jgi:hypothetical protein